MLRLASSWQDEYLERYYRSREHWIDGTTEFHEFIREHIPSDKRILELGPGPKNSTSDYLASHFATLDGLDVDGEAALNPALRQVHIYPGDRWPLADESYDAVVANYVLEHLAKPLTTIAEAYRVLRPEGLLFFRTPNLWHYVSMVSRHSPHWFHKLVSARLRNLPEEAHEPYPTYYRINRRGTVRTFMRQAGFDEVAFHTIEKEPSYGMSSRALFFLFMGYERAVNSCDLFSMFRGNILGAYQKPLCEGSRVTAQIAATAQMARVA